MVLVAEFQEMFLPRQCTVDLAAGTSGGSGRTKQDTEGSVMERVNHSDSGNTVTTDYEALRDLADDMAKQAGAMEYALDLLQGQWNQMTSMTSGLTTEAFRITSSGWMAHMRTLVSALDEAHGWVLRRIRNVQDVEADAVARLARI
ncbi:MAG: WXG100 family type VII secretion target [Propionibacteriaceae bacterium]|nr:WXG100 family type VII secretion target [Propionibacteriaceae bacterium]